MLRKNEIEGKGKQIKGAIKENVGELTDNPGLEAKGEVERQEGKNQTNARQTFRKVDERVKKSDKDASRKR